MEHFTSETFDQAIAASEKPVLVDFWASWCGPCQMMAPVLEEVEKQHPDITVGKVNVDEEGALAMRFGINSIPAFVYFKNGEPVKATVGYMHADELCKTLGIE